MYTVDKSTTNSKIRTNLAKIDAFQLLKELLIEKLGEDSVGMVRFGGEKKTNELAFKFDEVTCSDGSVVPLVATINPVVRDFEERSTKSKTYFPFDFDSAKNDYEEWVAATEQKAIEGVKKKKEQEQEF